MVLYMGVMIMYHGHNNPMYKVHKLTQKCGYALYTVKYSTFLPIYFSENVKGIN